MAETQFEIGVQAHCVDGSCGEVSRVVIDPAAGMVTHLAIGSKHRRARLVPLDLVDATADEISVRCTLAEFEKLEAAEETQLVEGYDAGTGAGGLSPPMGVPHPVMTVVEDIVPVGEAEVGPGEPVHALDGEIGRVRGFLTDPDDHRVTHVLLEEGHFWGRKEVAIPASAVAGVEDGVRLNITKKEVEELPPAR
jgi:sporulation protein YlmC with PRC-barrel domain